MLFEGARDWRFVLRVGNVFLPKALIPRTVGTCLVDCRQCRKLSMAGLRGQEAADQPFCDSLKATRAAAMQSCLCQGIVLPGKVNTRLAELFSLFLYTLPDQILSWLVYLTVKLCVKHSGTLLGWLITGTQCHQMSGISILVLIVNCCAVIMSQLKIPACLRLVILS